jgi:hypothetical protein
VIGWTVAALAIAAPEFALEQRAPLWIAINLPAKQFASASVSEIVELADQVARRTTDLKVKVVPDAVVDPCAARGAEAVACFARALKRDSRFLLMVSAIGETQVVSLLVDLDEAQRILRESAQQPEEEANRLVSRAVVASTLPAELRDQTELEKYFDEFFSGDLAPIFERAGARTFGNVELTVGPGAAVSMDGKPLGSSDGPVTIRDVPAGTHVLKVEQDGFEPWETQIEVRALEVARVTASMQSTSIAFNRAFRQATFYGGLVAVATGVALSVASLFDDSAVCFGSNCPGSYVRTSILPVGYSVAGMGAAWTLGAWLGDEDAFPWIELLAGVVVFGVSYGLTWAVEPRCDACTIVAGR